MRRPVLGLTAITALFLGCKKETADPTPPPATTTAATTASAAASAVNSAPPRATRPPLEAQLRGNFTMYRHGPLLLLEDRTSQVFFVATSRGIEQLKDLRRGRIGKADQIDFLGAPPDHLWAVSQHRGEEGPATRIWRRTGDFWGEAGSEIYAAVVPWSEGRALGLIADSSTGDVPTPLAFRLVGGKGPVVLPRFTPFPTPRAAPSAAPSAPAPSAAPSASTPPAASGPAASASSVGSTTAPTASVSPSSSGSSGQTAAAVAAASVETPEAPPPRCRQRLTLGGDEAVAALPTGQVFVAGFDCAVEKSEQGRHPVVEHWDAARKKNRFEELPAPAAELSGTIMLASAAERAFVIGTSSSPYVAAFDGTAWKLDAPPWKRASQAALDETGKLWVLTADEGVWVRETSGEWNKVTLHEPSGSVVKPEAMTAQGERVWVVGQGTVFTNLPAPAKLAEVGTITVNKPEKSDYWDFSASPLCLSTYVKLGPVKPPSADIDKNFPGLRDALRGKGLPAMDYVYEDRGGQQNLGLRAPSLAVAERAATLLNEADPKSGAKVICHDPRGLFLKKTAPLDLGS